MKTQPTAEEISQKLEALVLTAILNVLNRIRDELSVVSQQKMKF